MLWLPGPASSEEERSLRKIVFSGDPSLNPASSKKKARVFCMLIFAKSATPILQYVCIFYWNSGIEQSAIYWRQTVATFPLGERIVNNNLQLEEISPTSTDVMYH